MVTGDVRHRAWHEILAVEVPTVYMYLLWINPGERYAVSNMRFVILFSLLLQVPTLASECPPKTIAGVALPFVPFCWRDEEFRGVRTAPIKPFEITNPHPRLRETRRPPRSTSTANSHIWLPFDAEFLHPRLKITNGSLEHCSDFSAYTIYWCTARGIGPWQAQKQSKCMTPLFSV